MIHIHEHLKNPRLDSPLKRKLGTFVDLTDDELAMLTGLERGRLEIPARSDILRQGDPYEKVYMVKTGWAIRYKSLSDGRRQIVNFVLPGDFIGFNAAVFMVSDFSVTSTTAMTLSSFEPEIFLDIMAKFPKVCLAISWCHAQEDSVLREHLLSVGRRSAYERTAHLLVELWRRLTLLGLAEDEHFQLPITQEMLADALGLSTAHVNRMLQELRLDGLIALTTIPATKISISDSKGLEAAAGFTEGYLHFTEIPQRMADALDART